jgi:predicted transcriptional regulator
MDFIHFAFCEMRKNDIFVIMRKHNGMRPQDIAILLKLMALNKHEWQLQPLSNELYISISEISESLNRSRLAHLIDYHKKRPNRQAILEFIEHGVKYVFPQEPGSLVKGIPTAHSHPYIQQFFHSERNYVWPDVQGEMMGQNIEPLYTNQTKAARQDPVFYKLLALVDVIRVGKVREVNIAIKELKNQLSYVS